jgi:hypothetical protein
VRRVTAGGWGRKWNCSRSRRARPFRLRGRCEACDSHHRPTPGWLVL